MNTQSQSSSATQAMYSGQQCSTAQSAHTLPTGPHVAEPVDSLLVPLPSLLLASPLLLLLLVSGSVVSVLSVVLEDSVDESVVVAVVESVVVDAVVEFVVVVSVVMVIEPLESPLPPVSVLVGSGSAGHPRLAIAIAIATAIARTSDLDENFMA